MSLAKASTGQRPAAVVIGAGPAGCAAAITLCQRNIGRVIMIADVHPATDRLGESIPPDAQALLRVLGAWPAFVAQHHAPCLGSQSCWGTDVPGHNDFVFNAHGPGWHLDRIRFDTMLQRQAADSGVEIWSNTRLATLLRNAAGYELKLMGEHHGSLLTEVLIDASGVRRAVARALGACDRTYDRLLCLGAFLPQQGELGQATLLEAVEYGWWYAAALPGQRSVVMLATDPRIARQRGLGEPERWRAALSETHLIFPKLGQLPDALRLHAKAASSSFAEPLCGAGWISVGDAASSYDPLSAQGIYKALATGMQGATAVAEASRGRPTAVREYHRSVLTGFNDFLRNRAYFYGLEKRWFDAPFWRSRSHLETPIQRAIVPRSLEVSASTAHQEV